MIRISVLILAFLIGSCTPNATPVLQPISNRQCDSSKQYCIDFSAGMESREWTDNWTGVGGMPTDHTISNGKKPQDVAYLRADIYSINNCSPSLTGASQTENIEGTNGNSIWGKVDVWENFGEGDIPDWENVVCKKDGIPPPSEVYALCSEKDGKRVLICISQMTDNPGLAEEMFRTFRWGD